MLWAGVSLEESWMAGGMGLSAKTSLKSASAAAELEFEGATEDFVRQYFGLNDDLAQISTLHRQRRLHPSCASKV